MAGDDGVVERFKAVARQHTPRLRSAAGTGRGSGASQWVERLFDTITSLRAAAWTWNDVVDCLNEAKVPLADGRVWNADMVSRLYRRAVDRRAGRGTWRAIKRGHAKGHDDDAAGTQSADNALSAEMRGLGDAQGRGTVAEAVGAPAFMASMPIVSLIPQADTGTGATGGRYKPQPLLTLNPRRSRAQGLRPPALVAPPMAAAGNPYGAAHPGMLIWDRVMERRHYGDVADDGVLRGPPPGWDGTIPAPPE